MVASIFLTVLSSSRVEKQQTKNYVSGQGGSYNWDEAGFNIHITIFNSCKISMHYVKH